MRIWEQMKIRCLKKYPAKSKSRRLDGYFKGQTVNWKKGFKRITLVLAIVIAVACGVVVGLLPIRRYDNAHTVSSGELLRFNLIAKEHYERSVEEDPLDKNESKSQRINRMIGKNIEYQQKKSFWYNLSIAELIGMVVLYGLGGAVVGYVGTWVVLWYGGLAIFILVGWLILGFADKNSKDEQKE